MDQLDRREFLARGTLLLAAPGAILAAGCGASHARPLSPIFQNWIVTLHPAIEQGVNEDPRWSSRINAVVAPPGGVDINDFIQEAGTKTSSWDVFVGMTPWADMARLVDAGAIEPWDDYLTPEALADVRLGMRTEAAVDGRTYSWPFLSDVVVQGWNAELVERAGLDPTHAPATWDEYIASARRVVETGVAPYGCTFDPRGWRSLVPMAHSLASDLYTADGLFDFTHPAAVEALEVMRRMLELAQPAALEPESGLASITSDEASFAAQTVAYLVKYQNSHVRFSSSWPDPSRLSVAALPASGGPGGTVFWTTGAALLRYGQRKREAAAYVEALTHDQRIWRQSMGTGRDAGGQLPPYRAVATSMGAEQTWQAPWVADVAAALRTAREIPPHILGARQFTVSQPYWEEYLLGEESSARRALSRAMVAVRAEARKVTE